MERQSTDLGKRSLRSGGEGGGECWEWASHSIDRGKSCAIAARRMMGFVLRGWGNLGVDEREQQSNASARVIYPTQAQWRAVLILLGFCPVLCVFVRNLKIENV